MSWLQQHMEEFVKPVLGFVPSEPLPFFLSSEMAVIKNIWKSVKREAGGRTILLPGRDVFVFEILARRENYPTVFRPDISRNTVSVVTLDSRDMLLLDTGFAGSIPKGLGIERFKLVSFYSRGSVEYQVFPNLGWARTIALRIESMPKYWESARIVNNVATGVGVRVVQELNDKNEFAAAARLTLAVYKDSTRRKLWTTGKSSKKPKGVFVVS